MEVWNYSEVLLLWRKKGLKNLKFQFNCFNCKKPSETTLSNLKQRGLLCSNCSRVLTKSGTKLSPELTKFKESTEVHLKDLDQVKPKYFKDKETQEKINQRRKTSVQEKYGESNVSKVQSVKSKILETQKETYGSAFLASSKAREALSLYRESHLEEIQAKTIQTCLERYGTEFYLQSEDSKSKTKESCLEKYGVDNVSKVPEVLEKIKTSTLEKFGVENIMQLPGIQDYFSSLKKDWWQNLSQEEKRTFKKKISESLISYWQNLSQEEKDILSQKRKDWWNFLPDSEKESFKKKISESCKEYWQNLSEEERGFFSKKHSEIRKAYWQNLPEFDRLDIKRKIQLAWSKKTPEEKLEIGKKIQLAWTSKTPREKLDIRRKSSKHNQYLSKDGEKFDSKWELAYYEYCKSKGYEIKREPIGLDYEYLGTKHIYYPDFEVEGKLVEVKGNHLKDKEGKWINPYDRTLDGLYEAKRQCAIKNKVIILYEEDLDNLGIKL